MVAAEVNPGDFAGAEIVSWCELIAVTRDEEKTVSFFSKNTYALESTETYAHERSQSSNL